MSSVGRRARMPAEPYWSRRDPATVAKKALMKTLGILVLGWVAVISTVSAQTGLELLAPAQGQPESVEGLIEKAEQGEAQAQYDLAVHYANRRAGQLAADEAVHWLHQAAEQGHAEAQSDLGLLYHRGLGVPRDPAEAAKWMRRAAEQGHAVSQADLGQLYYFGAGVPRDLAKAAEWYRKAADQGVAGAQFNLAALYATGEGVPKDAVEAVTWYREAAGLGLAEAQYALALALLRGEGVRKNLPAAVRWARGAALQGHAVAQFLLARQYEMGLGTNRDMGRAVRWYLFSADQGLVDAQRSLGTFYSEGRGGIVDPIQGRMWLIIASLNAPEEKREMVTRELNQAGHGMTAEQTAEAERLARQWKRKTWAELRAGSPGELIPGGRFTNLSGFFRTAGRNISAAETEYEDYWRPHLEKSRRGIREAARLVSETGTALILGAGKCREIPLEGLARKFDRVVLVDLDGPSMRQAVATLPDELRSKIEVRLSDVTSFAQPLMEATSRIVENAQSADEAFSKLGSQYRDIETLRRFPELPRADLVISSLVLSELARYPSTYTAQLVKEKFDADLSEWSGYGELWRNLRTFASEDHAEMLERLSRPGGVIYFADTVARGPDLGKVDRGQRRLALSAIAGRFARLGLFEELRTRPESWGLFKDVFRKIQVEETAAKASTENAAAPNLEKLVADIEASPGAAPDRADIAAEAATRLLCQDHLPIETEIAAYEAILETYRDAAPGSLEQLLDWDAFFGALEGSDLGPVSDDESWWWLEYACSIPRKAGGFLVRGRVLRRRVTVAGRAPFRTEGSTRLATRDPQRLTNR